MSEDSKEFQKYVKFLDKPADSSTPICQIRYPQQSLKRK